MRYPPTPPTRSLAMIAGLAISAGPALAETTTPVQINMGARTVTISVAGQTITRSFPPVTMPGSMVINDAGDQMILTSSGTPLTLERVCASSLDVGPAAESLEDITVEDLIGPTPAAWRGEFMVEDVQFDYAIFPDGSGAYRGYARTSNANHVAYANYSVQPTGPTEGERSGTPTPLSGC